MNLATSLYFGAESEFIIAAQTFSSLRIAKCGLELTTGALNESVPSNICSWDDFLLAGKLFLRSYSPGK